MALAERADTNMPGAKQKRWIEDDKGCESPGVRADPPEVENLARHEMVQSPQPRVKRVYRARHEVELPQVREARLRRREATLDGTERQAEVAGYVSHHEARVGPKHKRLKLMLGRYSLGGCRACARNNRLRQHITLKPCARIIGWRHQRRYSTLVPQVPTQARVVLGPVLLASGSPYWAPEPQRACPQ